jgi:hypothetical protein
MRIELEFTWKGLNSSLPLTLNSLGRTLSPSRRPAIASRRALDAARKELATLTSEWQEAQVEMQSGRLAVAVIKAEEVKRRAGELVTDVYSDS